MKYKVFICLFVAFYLSHAFNLNLSLIFIAPNSFIKYFITYGMPTKLQSFPPHAVHTVDILFTY